MKRLLWLVLGAATGILTVRKIRDLRKPRGVQGPQDHRDDRRGARVIAVVGGSLTKLRAFITKFLHDVKRAAAKQEAALFTELETRAAAAERARSAAAEPVYSGRHAAR